MYLLSRWQSLGCADAAAYPCTRRGAGRGLPALRLSPRDGARARRLGQQFQRRRGPGGGGRCRRPFRFCRRDPGSPPPNATIVAVEIREIEPVGETTFAIRPSEIAGSRSVEVLPDLATCAECLAELFDPYDRRCRYPFINCTQCGPRYSIIEEMPYDRARTTMRRFPMCAACQAEYEDPRNRRFHAEPNACLDCGPRLALWDPSGRTLARDHEAPLAAAAALRHGQIVAVKGIGGFHLFADARKEAVVRRLRAGKQRESKPFAVMFPSFAAAKASCRVGPRRKRCSPGQRGRSCCCDGQARRWCSRWRPTIPGSACSCLMRRCITCCCAELGFPVVATSGNVTDEPIVTDEAEAIDRLAGDRRRVPGA